LFGGGDDDTLTGSSGNDTFVFNAGFGHDTITNFAAGSGVGDVIEFRDGMFVSFAAVIGASQRV
jgi:Ca2+-binding RTX toxin-like protein